MALTDAEGNVALASATVNALAGTYKIRADGFADGNDHVVMYEETNTATAYAPVLVDGQPVLFTLHQPSMVLELYGNYKFVLSGSGLSVGYATSA